MEARDLKGILDTLEDIIIFSDPGGMVQFVNFRASSMVPEGYAAIGRSIFCVVHENNHTILREGMEKVKNGEDSVFLFRTDVYEVSLKAVKNRKDQYLGFLLWHSPFNQEK